MSRHRRGLVAVVLTASAAVALTTLQVAAALSSPTSWGTIDAPLPPNAVSSGQASLSLPVCPQVRECWAIGSYQTSAAGEILLEHLTGGEWVPSAAPLPADAVAGTPSAPGGIACPTVGWCVAVGTYTALDSEGQQGLESLIDMYSKGKWTAVDAPLPPTTGSPAPVLSAVSCPAVGSCVAIGDYNMSGRTGFVDTLSHGVWHTAWVYGPGSSGSALSGVDCFSAGVCDVTGTYGSGSATLPMVDALAGGVWTVSGLPLPADAVSSDQVGVPAISCATATSCVAVGEYATASGSAGLLETLAGGSWAAAAAPLPAGHGNAAHLDGVACTTSTSCTAIGDYTTDAVAYGVIDSLAGGSWSATEAPLPAGGQSGESSQLSALSCVPPDACVAVGELIVPAGVSAGTSVQGLLDTGSSGGWLGYEAPEPGAGASRIFVTLSGVSCANAAYCVTVGSASELQNGPSLRPALIVATPRMTLVPAKAAPGATVTVVLSGFEASQQVDLTWATPGGSLLASPTTDASGSATTSAVVPSATPGTYHVYARSAGGATATSATLVVS